MITDVPLRLRDDPDFRRYWLARSSSLTGSMVTAIALPVLVYRLSGSPFLTALVTALEAAPYLLVGLFAGALADRWNRRRVMVSADLVNTLVIGSVPLAYLAGILTVAQVLVVGFVVQMVFTFFDGANFGALPVLVGRERVAQANAAVWTASSLIELFVPPLAAVLLAVLNPASLLTIDALSFAASAVAIGGIVRAMSEPRTGQRPLRPQVVFADIAEGLRFLIRHAGVRTMTIVGSLQSFAGGGFMALMVVWCDRVLHIGTSGIRFGLVYGTWGIGGLIAALGLPRLLKRMPPAAVTLYAIPVSAALGIVSPLMPNWELAAIALLVWGSAYVLVIVNAVSYRQQVTPEQLLGRVNTAGRMLSWGVGWTGGSVVGGVLGSWLGIRSGMVLMGIGGVVAVVVAWTSPLRRIAAAHDPLHA
ncbi:putative MFS family arabinose efflux permease [Kribbella voronezhensis]|uniref:Putative MFS family arabinose efflux permease n=1 Tax=Kribbella voronezhensis TaxID=2512212 RepID=A0A4V3FJL0_9ACTN|nr:MFS transporter [Kribbella voronezhensis]TDU86813.1 putative MFS family arabinose efflux permease [Kribbella voronezhensis]